MIELLNDCKDVEEELEELYFRRAQVRQAIRCLEAIRSARAERMACQAEVNGKSREAAA